MAYVNVPKDLTKVKTKVLFNLTKRQLICFGSGALIGVPLFFLLKGSIGTSPAAMVMMVVMIPAMLFAMYEKNGQPLEVVIRNIYRVCFQRPKQRPYKTNNFYAVLERQNQLDREVYLIVRKESQYICIIQIRRHSRTDIRFTEVRPITVQHKPQFIIRSISRIGMPILRSELAEEAKRRCKSHRCIGITLIMRLNFTICIGTKSTGAMKADRGQFCLRLR